MRRPAITRTTLLLLLAVAGAAFAFVAPSAQAGSAYTASSYASRLLALVNDARADHGLGALHIAGGTTTVAAGWTSQLAADGALSHNPDLRRQLENHGSPDWTAYGENVGQGAASDPDGLFTAYMNSPEHRANILTAAYRYVGVAVVFTGRTAWNTFDFVDTYGTASTQPRTDSTPTRTTTKTKPAAKTSTPAPVPAASASTPDRDSTPQRSHETTRPQPRKDKARAAHRETHQPVRVQGVRTTALQLRPMPQAALVATSPADVTAATDPLVPDSRSSRAVLVACALLVLVAAARRWTLTVTAR